VKKAMKALALRQANDLIEQAQRGEYVHVSSGWVKTVRLALGMSLRQLAARLGLSTNALAKYEQNEQNGSISLSTLAKAAEALDMELVYYLRPKGGTLQQSLESQARRKAAEILERSNQTMMLERQETSAGYRALELDRLTNELREEMPRTLWD
jgi:predicted DNA-binding mobile mystery protein A